MTTWAEEWATRVVPWTEGELGWQRRRPPEHRVPLPEVGAAVLLRWGRFEHPVPATVTAVPDLGRGWRWEDFAPGSSTTPDGWVWTLVRDSHAPGAPPILDANGLPQVRLLPDPHPVITLRVDGSGQLIETREGRLRGAPGWLPLDWEDRYRPSPIAGKAAWNLVGPDQRLPFFLPDGTMITQGY